VAALMRENEDKHLKSIFNLMFKKLQEISINDTFLKEINERKERVFDKNKPDSYFYEIMIRDIFGAGFRATAVTKRWPSIREAFAYFDIKKVSEYDEQDLRRLMNNPNIIRNKRKLEACIYNAKKMKELSEQFGSFGEFLDYNKNNFVILEHKLVNNFRYLGNIVVLDYLKDIGMDIIKPDVHVMRVFFRLGFIESEDQTRENINKLIEIAEQIKRETGEKLAVIDAVFWIYGGGGDGHVKKAICSKNEPSCYECSLTNYCKFHGKRRN
jgi:DNA-3-methyladenine glycosylase I